MLVVCERWVGDGDRLLFWPKGLLATTAALLPHLGWDRSTVGHWGSQALSLPLALNSASCLQLAPTTSGTWLYNCLTLPASAVLPLIYTGASLNWRFGRGSICNISWWFSLKFELPQVSPCLLTLLGILANLSNTVFGIVSTRTLISTSTRFFINPLVT